MTPEQAAVIEAAREWHESYASCGAARAYDAAVDALGAAVDALDAAEQAPAIDPDAPDDLTLSHLVADVGRLRERLRLIEEDHEDRIRALEAERAEAAKDVDPNVHSHDTPLPEWLTYTGWGQWESTVPYDPATGMPTVEPEPTPKPATPLTWWVIHQPNGVAPDSPWLVSPWLVRSDDDVVCRCWVQEDAERVAAALNAQEGSW